MSRPQPSSPAEARRWRAIRAREGWEGRRHRGYVPRGRQAPRLRDRHAALALAYPTVQQVSRRRFAELFAEERERAGVRVSSRGEETAWAAYTAAFKAYRVKGQELRTTNAQRGRALELAGRPRCRRTIQRTHRLLERMGLLTAAHVKLGGAEAGRRDHLRVTFHQVMSPRLRQQEHGPSGLAAPAPTATDTPADNGGRDPTPALRPANSTITEREEPQVDPSRPAEGRLRSAPSPFTRCRLEPELEEQLIAELLEAWEASTESDPGSDLEQLANAELHRIHAAAIADADDRAPSYFSMLAWAAARPPRGL